MGRGVDIEHTLEGLESGFYGKVAKIMKRKCQGGKRLLDETRTADPAADRGTKGEVRRG